MAHTPDPEQVIASSAKLCYSASGIEDIQKNLTDKKTENFLKMLVDIGHESPIEHISFTFGIEGVSRVLTHQLVRHRLASYSQQSQRYVKLDQFEYIIPPAIEENDAAKKIFIESMKKDQQDYNEIADLLTEKYKKEYIAQGIEEQSAVKKAEKKAIEDARFVFPNACETKIVMTMNARSLMNFFTHRCCNRAQWEIRDLATEVLRQCRQVAPVLFAKAGPSCLRGPCPEGKMSCGKMEEVREKFSNL
jgi:thymidylate synthase (FAD)